MGKSTFINAIIGEEILPSSSLEQTKVFYKIKHHNHPHTLLMAKNPQTKEKKLISKESEEIKNKINENDINNSNNQDQ